MLHKKSGLPLGSPGKSSEFAYRLDLGFDLTLILAALTRSGFSIPRMSTKRITRMTIMKSEYNMRAFILLLSTVVYTPYTTLSIGKISKKSL